MFAGNRNFPTTVQSQTPSVYRSVPGHDGPGSIFSTFLSSSAQSFLFILCILFFSYWSETVTWSALACTITSTSTELRPTWSRRCPRPPQYSTSPPRYGYDVIVCYVARCRIFFFLQLLEVLIAEDDRVLADVQGLEQIAPFVADVKSEVFERRRSLRYDVIRERLDNYKRVSFPDWSSSSTRL